MTAGYTRNGSALVFAPGAVYKPTLSGMKDKVCKTHMKTTIKGETLRLYLNRSWHGTPLDSEAARPSADETN